MSPQGEVGELRQLVVRFSEPVVPLGDGRQADPATVQCSGPVPAGSGRWLEPQAWAYESAARCRLACAAPCSCAPTGGRRPACPRRRRARCTPSAPVGRRC
ncbi:hypothetical protein ABXN37_27265 [Piscinibacter sakaiensis]|uniref:hypothetical protein n=1 Tax=Piscinibacter sakaiensis TaxID=1547922 RepID=UPI003729062B